jgi:hypothetical protein
VPYQMEIISLRCNDTQLGRNAPYLLVNSQIAWGPKIMQTGDTRTIGRRVSFDHTLSVELRESNGTGPSMPYHKDDHIGKMTLGEIEVRQYIRDYRGGGMVVDFHCDRGIIGDASYTLTYELDEF